MSKDWEWVESQFERCWPWLQAALDSYPLRTHRKEDVWAAIKEGHAQLWPTDKSCCVTEIKTYPSGLRALCGWLAGGNLGEIQQTVKTIEDFAKGRVDVLTISGRRGWLRSLDGYKEAGSVLMKEVI